MILQVDAVTTTNATHHILHGRDNNLLGSFHLDDKLMLLRIQLGAAEGKSGDGVGQNSTVHTIEEVFAKAVNFEDIFPNLHGGALNVGVIIPNLGSAGEV